MSAPRPACRFAYLQHIGLLDGRQYRRAVADPESQALSASPTLVAPLAWLMRKDIVSADELVAAFDHLELASDQDMVDQALEQDELFCMKGSAVCIDLMVREGLLRADERDGVLEGIGFERALSVPGDVLFQMVNCGLMTRERFDALHDVIGGSARRDAILDHADFLFSAVQQRKDFKPIVPPKGRWLWLEIALWVLGPVLLAFAIGGVMRLFTALPACDGWSVRGKIDSMLPRGVGATPTGMREVGYIDQTGVRGCSATASVGGKALAFAYTVAKDKKGDELVVVQADPVIVQTRFGRRAVDGQASDLTYPIKRSMLEWALRDGVAAAKTQADILDADLRQELARKELRERWALSARELRGEIADVEPVVPCRALVVNQRYRCRLLIERNDPLRMGVGAPSTLHEGEFTFEQGGYVGVWGVSKDFKSEYAAAIAAPRPAR
ncbi:hypothetical protein [Massilia sp. CCM 8734]|uniref:hypothetical protein n=1 Tax=Massilia sp. CCM 8734 TaxID=2609283 RepID=UPI001423172C|nr:hypothetical protein [Massilia sp. CCM 8734]NHZ95327.1 hypothetical protein [Massilia sp. CCM 8734]